MSLFSRNTQMFSPKAQKAKTYNREDSLVVTDPTTNSPV